MVDSTTLTDEQLQAHVLQTLQKNNTIADSNEIVDSFKCSPAQVDAVLKSLLVDEYVILKVIERKVIELTEEGRGYAENGTPEYQYANCLELNVATTKADVEAKVGALVAKVGFAKAMKNKWVKIVGENKDQVERIAAELKDEDKEQLSTFLFE